MIKNMTKLLLLVSVAVVILTSGSATRAQSDAVKVSSNAHWLEFRGQKVLLIGDSVTQGWVELGVNFNQTAYVDALQSRGANILMIWAYMGITNQVADARIGYDAPEIWPWNKSGGLFNLDSLNQAYFDRLRALIQYANSKNVVVLITVHDGGVKWRWDGHPFKSTLGGPLTANTQYVELHSYGTEMPTTYNPSWTRQQKHQYYLEKFCNKLIAETADQPNVIYEMFNEGEWYNQTNLRAFQVHFLKFFKARTSRLTMVNDDHVSGADFRGEADCDIISLHKPNWSSSTNATDSFNHYAAQFYGTPIKPIYFSEPVPEYQGDSSLYTALTRLMWGTVIGGAGFVVQNDCSFGFDPYAAIVSKATERDVVLDREGHCARFFNNSGIAFWNMTPQGSLSSTGVCLANSGYEYVVWTQSQNFTVNLTAAVGSCAARFYNPRTGVFQPTFYVTGGGSVAFTAPDSSDWALHITANPDTEPPSVPTNVQATAQSLVSIEVTWTASTDNVAVAGYNVFRNGVSVGTSVATSFTDTGLQPNTTYSYTVSAYDTGGNNSAQSSPPAVVTTPSDTSPPSVPTNVQGNAYSMTAVQLTWTASTDDVGVAGYKVYRDGGLAGTNTWPNYSDTGLQSGTAYTYTVTAYDAANNESAHSSPPTVVTTPSVPDFCSVDLGSIDVNNYLSRVNYTTDGSTGAITVGGLNCRQLSNISHQYFYFAVDDTYIYNGSVSTTYLEVCYYDDLSSVAFIEPQYDSASDAYTVLPQVALTGTGKWKTATWTLTDCLFANRQNGGADFRLFVGPNAVKIDSVRISKSSFSEHLSVERDLGVNEIYSGLSHPQHADGNTMVQLKDGVYCKKPTTAGNNYFYFNVSDAVIYDGSCSIVELKVGYYDSEGGSITPEYDSTSGEYTAAETLGFAGTNTWKEHTWTLTDVKFANRQNASADFRLYVGTAQDVFVDTVVVTKVIVPDTEPPSVPENIEAAGVTPSAIRVTWDESTDNVSVAGYRIYRNGVAVGTSATTSFTDTGLTAMTSHSYRVSAFDAAGNESEMSSSVTAETMAAADLASAKELPDTWTVGLLSQTVTAVFNGHIYVGVIDRHSGVRVVPIETPEGIVVGDVIDSGGIMDTADGERRIIDATITRSSSQTR